MKRQVLMALGGGTALVMAGYLFMPRPIVAQVAPPKFAMVTCVIRDFSDTHPDFNVEPGNGYGHYCGNIDTTLGADGKPVFTGLGFRVSSEWRDTDSQQIAWNMYSPVYDDKEGKGQKGEPDTGAITSATTFNQWFNNVPGVNETTYYNLVLELGADGFYTYDTNDFYPIDDMLLGNEDDPHNFLYTVELAADFYYIESDNPILHFMGDDDIWVFIDDQLVIDLGGVAGNTDQVIHLNRLGLTDGSKHRMNFFMADRLQPKSQFHLTTNIQLIPNGVVPTPEMAYD